MEACSAVGSGGDSSCVRAGTKASDLRGNRHDCGMGDPGS